MVKVLDWLRKMLSINRRRLRDFLGANTTWLGRPELKIEEVFKQPIFKWRESVDKNHVWIK